MSPSADLGYHARRLPGARDLLALHRHRPERYPHLLESTAPHPRTGRWDLLFAFPDARVDGAEAVLAALDRPWPRGRAALPFVGGWFLYFAYELNATIEPRLGRPPPTPLPVARMERFPAAVLVDHTADCTWLVAEAGRAAVLETMAEDLAQAPVLSCPPLPPLTLEEEDPQRFLAGVRRIRRYIRAGDVFQVNLSRLWRAHAPGLDPAMLYARLRRANPAPFAALVRWPEGSIVSSSPERLVWSDGERIETRPIAGTLPREGDLAPDRRLLGDPKERAEHVMLIDLERNDLGRVCRPGSVRVDELMVIESYAHVHHIVSNVAGRLRPEVTPAAVVRALFPGGTITGCPKVRCMEIIAELEAAPRGPYTGSVGYLSRDGTMDLNILIRSFVLTGETLTLRAGAGIVHDSRPERELRETRAKARGLLAALQG